MMPESTDVSEIDKLTGVPKSNGKFENSSVITIHVALNRSVIIRHSNACTLHDN